MIARRGEGGAHCVATFCMIQMLFPSASIITSGHIARASTTFSSSQAFNCCCSSNRRSASAGFRASAVAVPSRGPSEKSTTEKSEMDTLGDPGTIPACLRLGVSLSPPPVGPSKPAHGW